MRELTALEIDAFDFSGRIPDLHVAPVQQKNPAPVMKARSQPSLKMRPIAKQKRGLQFA